MTRHASIDRLARFRDGDLGGARARRIATHLEGCARCREASAALAKIPELLAAAQVPEIPAHLAARIETALATESAHRAAGAPSIRAGRPGRARRPGHARHRERTGLMLPAGRILAAAVVVILAGGSYELVSHLGGQGASSPASRSPSEPAHAQASPNFAGPKASGGISSPVSGPLVQYGRPGHPAAIRLVRTNTNYQPAQLAQQVTATLAEIRRTPPGGGAFPSPDTARSLTAGQVTQLTGCVTRVAAGQTVLLVDVARFGGAPATVIVTAGRGSAPAQIWVAGAGCSASSSDVLTHRALPGS
jgi:Putative zinc-finger